MIMCVLYYLCIQKPVLTPLTTEYVFFCVNIKQKGAFSICPDDKCGGLMKRRSQQLK